MEEKRFVLFPIVDDETWRAYKDQEASFWTAEEIDLTDDAKHFRDRLNEGERRLLLRVLGFFAGSDTIVAQNINMNFIDECEKRGWLETVIAYQFQTMMENIHSEAYSLMIDELISDKAQRLQLFDSIKQIPSIAAKAEWCMRWMGKADRAELIPDFVRKSLDQNRANLSDDTRVWLDAECPTFGERLVAFNCVEAILFSSSFAIIFWFKKRGLLPGISFANELISRDERMHHEFGSATFMRLQTSSVLPETVSPARILEIVTSCVEIEKAFVRDALPVKLAGINEEKLCQYVEFMGDRVLLDLGCERHFYQDVKNPKSPCDWMEKISLDHKTNFFERRVTNYQRRGVKKIDNAATLNTFQTDAAF